MKTTLTLPQASEIRARLDRLNAWIDTKRGRNGWASCKPEEREAAGIPDVTNEERGALELFDFCQCPPDKYFLYINPAAHEATTWTGDKLGAVTFGNPWRDNFGGTRVPVTVRGVNGITYHGTYFKSSGSYARVKAAKKQAA